MPTTPIAMIGTATATSTTNKIATTKTTSDAATIIQHALSSKGKKATNKQQDASNDHSQHTTNHSESDDEIFALEEKHNINKNDQNIITKQDYVPEIIIGVLANVIMK
jgi:phage gp16-like protein